MHRTMRLSWVFLSLFLLIISHTPAFALKKSYIVYMGGHAHGPEPSEADFHTATETHVQLLGSFLGSHDMARESMIYSYNKHINGFSAMLNEEVAEALSKHPDVVSVFLSKPKKLHTTRSWDFLGLTKGGKVASHSLWRKGSFGENTIIASLDSGVWPEHPSFGDQHIGPIPSRWKGKCQNNTKEGVPCNRKLIGAQYFNKGYITAAKEYNFTIQANEHSARDLEGHGSHTLSTIGGNFMPNASLVGLGEDGDNLVPLGTGTSKSGSPKAHLAAYKVCWLSGNCYEEDLLAAFDTAIHDGVDVISLSLGAHPNDYFEDSIAIGSFHAVSKGIVVICSAGNNGRLVSSVTNLAPWIITVGASSTDRRFHGYVSLGNNKTFEGASYSYYKMPRKKYYPLISGADANAVNASADDAIRCLPGTLDPNKAKGKILACLVDDFHTAERGIEASRVGAVGMIICNGLIWGNQLHGYAHFLPATLLTYDDGHSVFEYINSTKFPTAYIAPVQAKMNLKPAPEIADFSARGPNAVTPEILKPDITAPGVDVLAAYTQATGPSEIEGDNRRVLFNLMSGTSMACPHVSGIVGLIKTLHSDWSPCAIKSAIMTSARIQDNEKKALLEDNVGKADDKATPFSYGAGHITPNHAADPGLVYDMTPKDYLNFLCGIGYSDDQINKVSTQPYKCPENYNILNFNYPSITVPSLNSSVTVTRTLTNVGTLGTYNAKVYHPSGIKVTVEPSILDFKKMGEEKTFKVTLAVRSPSAAKDYVFGKLTWVHSEGRHYVRTPITVKAWGNDDDDYE